jgi:hypothetical protein
MLLSSLETRLNLFFDSLFSRWIKNFNLLFKKIIFQPIYKGQKMSRQLYISKGKLVLDNISTSSVKKQDTKQQKYVQLKIKNGQLVNPLQTVLNKK